jgi:hypothetical protein
MPENPNYDGPYLGNASDIWIESDDRGFELHFQTDHGSYMVNIHGCSLTLLEQVDKQLRPYWAEAEDARQLGTYRAMTAEEIRDVYKDHPGKRDTMLNELEGGHRPW